MPKSLEKMVQQRDDILEIRNLMSRYSYMQWAGSYDEIVKLFAQKTEGVKAEIWDWGVYEGIAGIKRLYVGVHKYIEGDRKGILNEHTFSTPLIEVAGDGLTAQGLWASQGLETLKVEGRLQAYWSWWRYGVDFVKEDGKWKIWHLHMYGVFRTPYELSWVDTAPEVMNFPKELKADRPATYNWIYSPDKKTENVPIPPKPYKTWNDAMSYVK